MGKRARRGAGESSVGGMRCAESRRENQLWPNTTKYRRGAAVGISEHFAISTAAHPHERTPPSSSSYAPTPKVLHNRKITAGIAQRWREYV